MNLFLEIDVMAHYHRIENKAIADIRLCPWCYNVVGHLKYIHPIGVAFAWLTTGKHGVIHKTGNT